MKLIDYICKASGWTPVTRSDGGRPHRDITPGSVVDIILVDPYEDEFRILECQTILSVRASADNDCGHDYVELLVADGYGGFTPLKIAAYRMVVPCIGTVSETIDKLQSAVDAARVAKKIDWAEIDSLITGLRMSSENAVAIANAENAWNSSSLYC